MAQSKPIEPKIKTDAGFLKPGFFTFFSFWISLFQIFF